MRTVPAPIPGIPYPAQHLPALNQISPAVIEAVARDGMPFDSGKFDLGKVSPELDRALFFFYWVTDSNEVTDHLNLALWDLRCLPENHVLLDGAPHKRYELLIRLYFHEFYRLREIFNAHVKQAARLGWIEKADIKLARDAFHGTFEQAIDLRNNLVHGRLTWTGKEHFDLTMVAAAWETGKRLVDRETGQAKTFREVLLPVCERMSSLLEIEGVRASQTLGTFIDEFVLLASEV